MVWKRRKPFGFLPDTIHVTLVLTQWANGLPLSRERRGSSSFNRHS